ncbi:hypothetical protein LEMLEM_LOCUS14175, partial [Lemmus lemmus]
RTVAWGEDCRVRRDGERSGHTWAFRLSQQPPDPACPAVAPATRAGCTGDFLVKQQQQQQQKHQPSKQPRRAKKGKRKSPSLTPPRATRAPRLCADAAERSRRFDAPPKSMAVDCCTMHALCACTSECVPGSESCGG